MTFGRLDTLAIFVLELKSFQKRLFIKIQLESEKWSHDDLSTPQIPAREVFFYNAF